MKTFKSSSGKKHHALINFPMINQPWSLPRFLGVALFFLLTSCISCSTVHKIQQKTVDKENTADHSITTGTINSQTITTEKADTLIKIKADTAQIKLFISNVPSPPGEGVGDEADTAETNQSIESSDLKITIHSKPIYRNGKKTGTAITATAIKKADSLAVKIDKIIVSNIQAQTQTKKDITQQKQVSQVNKETQKKRFNLAGMLTVLGIIIIVLVILYYYLKKQY